MSLFRHPHLVRGVVHTTEGAFVIHRGTVDLPDDVGESLGWVRLDDDDGQSPIPRNVPEAHGAVQHKRSQGA